MSILYMTIGLPASGKSTYYNKVFRNQSVELISSDDIRQEVYGNVNRQDKNTEVFEIMRERTIKALESGKDVYYDATNLSRKRRTHFLNSHPIIKSSTKIALLFATPVGTCINLNAIRERKVPEEVIYNMRNYFNVPSKIEGFDSISIISYPTVEYTTGLSLIDTYECVPHDNPNHSLSIGEHMKKAYEIAKEEKFDRLVKEAVLFHDIGKPSVKTFKDKNGNESEKAHYYNHENVGAYIYLSLANSPFSQEEILEIALLIEMHMSFYNVNGLEAVRKKGFDEDFINKLIKLNYCDKKAH